MITNKINELNNIRESKIQIVCKPVQGRFKLMKMSLGKEKS